MLRYVVLSAFLSVACCARAADNPYPWIASAYLVKRDGRLLWAGGEQRRLPPASLAKMMTALLTLERGELDSIVAVSRGVVQETGTRIGLKPGERFRARDLLAATVIRSANDACRALADHLSKSANEFVTMMNRRAAALGLIDTNFIDPCGHDREGQYSTAHDLARLAESVMQFPEYMQLAGSAEASIRTVDGGRSFRFHNTNALVGRSPGVIGLKTGFTEGAGRCLVALAERDGVRVLIVLLGAPNRWWNAEGLLDRAFDAPAQ